MVKTMLAKRSLLKKDDAYRRRDAIYSALRYNFDENAKLMHKIIGFIRDINPMKVSRYDLEEELIRSSEVRDTLWELVSTPVPYVLTPEEKDLFNAMLDMLIWCLVNTEYEEREVSIQSEKAYYQAGYAIGQMLKSRSNKECKERGVVYLRFDGSEV